MNINILKRVNLEGIPSASGVERVKDNLWIIGDNSPWLYELNQDLDIIEKYVISPMDTIEGGILPKKHKADFEAMTSLSWDGDSALFIFGSGSKSPHRNIGKLILLREKPVLINYNLSNFYDIIKDKAKLKEEDFNIEAATTLHNKLYLFNRGKNKLIIIKLVEFKKYITGESDDFKIKSHSIDLPEIDGITAGFSGACSDPENNRLIFTASVENTSNWIDDGEVSGSFIGIIDINKLHHHYYPKCISLEENNVIIPVKVESISVDKSEKNKLACFIVTDSDGGISELFQIELFLKKMRK